MLKRYCQKIMQTHPSKIWNIVCSPATTSRTRSLHYIVIRLCLATLRKITMERKDLWKYHALLGYTSLSDHSNDVSVSSVYHMYQPTCFSQPTCPIGAKSYHYIGKNDWKCYSLRTCEEDDLPLLDFNTCRYESLFFGAFLLLIP